MSNTTSQVCSVKAICPNVSVSDSSQHDKNLLEDT